ncbi:MAG: hypothetical protein KDA96_17025 [Planctomycetaceae bacterium]|nr:hypothetical protein [Planctomycetaceae bacterium]
MLSLSPKQLFEEEPEFVTPRKVIPVWTDTVLHQAGSKGQRGCGGRVMFYSDDGKRAVRVDGSLVVYVWNDSEASVQRKADRKYVFTAEDLQMHYSKSTVGDSYSFWIPWDDTGSAQTELTLVVRFVGRNGAEVTSMPAKVILPGEVPTLGAKPVQNEPQEPAPRHAGGEHTARQHTVDQHTGIRHAAVRETGPGGIQRANFEEQSAEEPGGFRRKTLSTAEIPLTNGFLQRNMRAPQVFTPDELFDEDSGASSDYEDLKARTSVRNQSPNAPAGRLIRGDATGTDSLDEKESTDVDLNSLPEDRSLQFRHRVQTRRAAQRSVGGALSERYQSASRSAPWERD